MNQDVTDLRHELHAHPELSGQENETKRRLMDFVKGHTSLEVVDEGSWFYCLKKATHGNGRSGIAFRADFDALPIEETLDLPYCSQNPGVSHKCGHDGHAASLCGLALALEKEETDRDVWLIFQPAEEVGRGGRTCADFVAGQDISEVYAFHNRSGYPEGAIVVRPGLMQCASVGLEVHFTGKTSHASEPDKGISPAPAIASMLDYMQMLGRQKFRDFVQTTIIGVTMGDKNFGIAPGEGEVCYTLRSNRDDDLALLEEKIKEHAALAASANHLKVTFAEYDPFPATVNTHSCAEKVKECAEKNHFQVLPMDKPWRASEDFGWYTRSTPGAIFYIGDGVDYPDLHTKAFDFNDRIMDTAVRMFLSLI
ncbi:MAG: M20 family metallopeptidase [Lachnospiraceae bacterium]|nr:M20 family metallopeptidase [Lachnospiraceae bacterium]